VVDSDHEIAWRICRIALTCKRSSATRRYPSVLANAGLDDADLLIAVTQSDQTNLVACKVAHSIFNVPARIARSARTRFPGQQKLCSSPENFAVDYALCPEHVITEYIARLIDFPEALQVLSFGSGRSGARCRACLLRRAASW
jgi:Trk K+ transport system NAD-binding subunit